MRYIATFLLIGAALAPFGSEYMPYDDTYSALFEQLWFSGPQSGPSSLETISL